MKYFVSGFYEGFKPPVKRVRSFEAAKSRFHSVTFITSFYTETFESETRFTRHFNPLDYFMMFTNDNIHLHCVSVL